MKSIISIIIVLGLTVILISCNSGKNENKGETDVKTGVPPSLNPDKAGISRVQLSEKEQNELKIETVKVTSNFVDYPVVAPGVVFQAPNHASIISTPINGQVHEVYQYEGSWVRKGDVLFVIQSLDFGNLVSEYLQAFAEERFQTNRLARLKQLVEETISSASELERAVAEFDRAKATSRAAYSKLKAVGVTDNEIKMFAGTENIDPVLKIYAPIDGIIEKNFVELGQSVNALENLSRVLDTREVLIRAYVTPDDARLIKTGDPVLVSKREKQENILNTKITSINPGLDENSRSVIANIIVQTTDGWPKPGENVRLSIVTSTPKEIVAVPVEALTYDGNQAVVFVNKGNGIYEKRPIEVSEIRDKNVFVNSGLNSNEEVAVTNVFSLKALSRFEMIAEE